MMKPVTTALLSVLCSTVSMSAHGGGIVCAETGMISNILQSRPVIELLNGLPGYHPHSIKAIERSGFMAGTYRLRFQLVSSSGLGSELCAFVMLSGQQVQSVSKPFNCGALPWGVDVMETSYKTEGEEEAKSIAKARCNNRLESFTEACTNDGGRIVVTESCVIYERNMVEDRYVCNAKGHAECQAR